MNISELLIDLTIHYNAIVRKATSEIGLTPSQAFHLISIPNDGISMSQLAKRLGLDASTLTRNIQKLEKKGYIIRSHDLYDRRIQNVVITDHGLKIIHKIDNNLEKFNTLLIKKINIDDQVLLSELLEKLIWSINCIEIE